jgi:hypothetical protein
MVIESIIAVILKIIIIKLRQYIRIHYFYF